MNLLLKYGIMGGGALEDWQIWCGLASVDYSSFPALSNVIASSTARAALVESLPALQYMVANTTIMPAVLADSAWVTALDGCTRAVKVPTMTSNTAPSGTASATTEFSATYAAWKAFDKIETGGSSLWITSMGSISNQRLQYIFPASCYVYKTTVHNYVEWALSACKPQYYNGSSWVDANANDTVATSATKTFLSTTIGNSATWGVLCSIASGNYVELYEVQFYGLNLA